MSYTLELDFDVPAHRVADAVAAVKAVSVMGFPMWETPTNLLLRSHSLSKEDAIAAMAASRIPQRKRELLMKLYEGKSVAELATEYKITTQAIYQTQWSLREAFLRLGDGVPNGYSRTVVVVPDEMKSQIDAIQHAALRQYEEKKQ